MKEMHCWKPQLIKEKNIYTLFLITRIIFADYNNNKSGFMNKFSYWQQILIKLSLALQVSPQKMPLTFHQFLSQEGDARHLNIGEYGHKVNKARVDIQVLYTTQSSYLLCTPQCNNISTTQPLSITSSLRLVAFPSRHALENS